MTCQHIGSHQVDGGCVLCWKERAERAEADLKDTAAGIGWLSPQDHERLMLREIQERDKAIEWADKLAEAIGQFFNADIGEHTSCHCPWGAALDLLDEKGFLPPDKARVLVEALRECAFHATMFKATENPVIVAIIEKALDQVKEDK